MIYEKKIVYSKQRGFERKDISFLEEEVEVLDDDFRYIKKTDTYVLPGLVDIHSHGALGMCANDATKDAYETMDEHMLRNGISKYLPTVITDEKKRMIEICSTYAGYVKDNKHISGGLNLEGPFINPQKKGAHNDKYIIEPDIKLFRKMHDAGEGLIKVITVAPELPNALDFIRQASKLCRVAIGHTAADYDTAMRAFDAGATSVTHLFNAMNPMAHREPGVILAARDAGAFVELICDGVHLHPAVVRMVFSAFDKDKIILISDSISATGLADGSYELGGLKTTVCGSESRLEDGALAGSTTNLFECVKKAVELGVHIEDAVAAASINPLKFIKE